MNIYIYNCSNTFNYGSMMMGENFISYFNQVTGKMHDYYVETEDEIHIQRLKHATQTDKIYQTANNSLFKEGFGKYDYFYSYIKLKNVVSDFAKKIDLVVILGGDDFTEDYGWKAPLLYALQFNILTREGMKIIMFGQTMGPFHSFRIPLMKRFLSKISKIYPRDRLTFQYLMDLGLTNLCLTDDLALLPLAKQEKKEKIRGYITFCPSELIHHYCKEGNRESWIEFNLFMLNTIMDKYPDKKLILLAHVLRPEHVDDRIIVNELKDLLNEKYKGRIVAVNEELYPYEVRNFIQQSFFVVSGRMHAIVSSFQSGIPAIALSYSGKFWGIIGERYGLGEYILDVRSLNYDEMREKFIFLIDKIETEYLQIEGKLKANTELAKNSIMHALEEIKDLKT